MHSTSCPKKNLAPFPCWMTSPWNFKKDLPLTPKKYTWFQLSRLLYMFYIHRGKLLDKALSDFSFFYIKSFLSFALRRHNTNLIFMKSFAFALLGNIGHRQATRTCRWNCVAHIFKTSYFSVIGSNESYPYISYFQLGPHLDDTCGQDYKIIKFKS